MSAIDALRAALTALPGVPIITASVRDAKRLGRCLEPERKILTVHRLARELATSDAEPRYAGPTDKREALGGRTWPYPLRSLAQAITWSLGREVEGPDWAREATRLYRDGLRARGLWDPYLYYAEVCDRVREPRFEALVLFDAMNHPPLVRRLLSRAARRVIPWDGLTAPIRYMVGSDTPGALVDGPLPLDAVVRHADPYREAGAVADGLEQALEEVPADGIAVVSRHGASRGALADVLDRRGIPYSSEGGTELLEAPIGRLARGFLQVAAFYGAGERLAGRLRPGAGAQPGAIPDEVVLRRRPDLAEVESVLTCPALGFGLTQVRAWAAEDPGQGRRLDTSLDARLLGANLADAEAVERVIGRARQETRWQRLLGAPAAPRTALLRFLYADEQWLDRLGRPAWQAVRLLADAVGDAATYLQALEALDDLGEESIRSHLAPGTVHLLTPFQLGIGPYERLFVLRMNEGVWPAVTRDRDLSMWAELWETTRVEAGARLLAVETALFRGLPRALGDAGRIEVHALASRESMPSRFLDGYPVRTVRPRMPVRLDRRAAWLEARASAGLRGEGEDRGAALDLARWLGTRASLPAVPPEPEAVPQVERLFPTLKVSATRLRSYQDCPRKFLYGVVYGIDVEDDSGRLGLGVLVHAVLEEAYRFDLPDWDGSGSPPRVGVPASLPPGERYQWLAVRYAELARGKYVLRSTYRARDLEDRLTGHELALHELFADAQRAEDADSRVAFVEHAFEVPLAEGIALRGKIDRVDRLPDGGIEVVDYKTGKRPGPWKIKDDVDRAERIAADPQTLAYGVAASLDPRLSALGPLRAMRYVFLREQLPDQDTLPEAVAAPLPLDEAREALLVLARAIQAEQFQPSPGSDCKRCPFSGICPAGEAADAEAE